VSNSTDYTQTSNALGRGFVGELDNAVRENPVSAALIGMGVLWLFFGGGKATSFAAMLPGAARDAASGIASALGSGMQTAADGMAAVGERARDIGRGVGETFQDAVSTASAAAGATAADAWSETSDAASAAAEGASRIGSKVAGASGTAASSAFGVAGALQSNLAQTFERQPLLLGAIGVALGAGIGAALPISEVEEEHLGQMASKVVGQAQEFAEQKAETLTSMAHRVFEEAKSEAEHQGLTPAAAIDALSGVGDKLKAVAGDVRKQPTKQAS